MKTRPPLPTVVWKTVALPGGNTIMVTMDEILSNPPPPERWAIWMAEANLLIRQGYRRISSRHGVLARVDRPDWQEALRVAFPHSGTGILRPDYYRRSLSQDRKTVNSYVKNLIPSSSGDETGYIDLSKLNE